MISRTLVKLIDRSIIPAILLLCARLSSIVLVSYINKIDFSFGQSGFVFKSRADYLMVNSYSVFAMIAVLAVGISYILLKSYIFHDTHITPVLTAQLFNLRLTTLIQNSFELYSQGVIWIIYLYLITAVTAIFAFAGLIYNWVLLSGLIISMLATVILLFDVENEMEIKRNEDKFIEDDTPIDIYDERMGI